MKKIISAVAVAVLSLGLFGSAYVSAQQSGGGGGAGGGTTYTGTSPIVVTGSVISCPTCGTSTANVSTSGTITPGQIAIWASTTSIKSLAVSGDGTLSSSAVLTVKGINGTLLSGLSTGILKNTTTSGVPSIAASADVIALFSGTCSVSTYLRGDGACAAAVIGATSGGGLTGTTTLGLLTSCSTNQVLAWNGSAWACATPASSGANTALSNLASVAVNTPLLVASAGASGLGTAATPFGELNATQVTNTDSVVFAYIPTVSNTGFLFEGKSNSANTNVDVFTVDQTGNIINGGSDSVGTSLSVGTTGTFGSTVQIGSAGSLGAACPSTVTALCWTAGSTSPTPTAGIDILWPNSGTNTIQASQNGGSFFSIGSVTSIATTPPITGGTITGTGTIACSTCATTTNGGALTATSPATISAAGVIACATCVTSSGGGAMTATSPVTVSGAGLIAISGVTSEQGNGSKLQLSTGTTTTNDCVKFDANGNTIDAGAACGSGGAGTSALAAVTNTTSVTQSNPTAATDVQLMELSLAASYLNSAGQPFAIHGSGVLSTTTASTPQVTITAKLCSVSGCGSGTVTPLAAIQSSALNTVAITNASWNYEIIATTVGTGASCNLIVKGAPGLTIENGASLAAADSVYTDSNTAVSSPNQTCTNALFIDFFVQQSATGASNSYKQLLGAIMPQGGGPVVSVSGDGTLITNSASTSAVTLALGNAGAHKWWGNNTGSTAAPGYQTIGTADLPTIPIAGGGTNATSAATGQIPNTTSTTATSWTSTPTLGASGTAGSIAFGNATSGTVTLQPVTGALGSVTASLPASTGTLDVFASTTTTANKVVVSTATAGANAYIDFPDVKTIPAANCNNTTAGAGWSIGSGGTVTCRVGTNNKSGFVAITDTSSTFAQFSVVIPEDWDSASNPFIRFQVASTDTTSGHTIIPAIQVSCAKGDGTTTDDVTFNASHSLSTITLNTTANQFWSNSNVQMNSTDMTGCVAGALMIVQVGRATDTATQAAFVSATVTFPRLIVVQAN